MSEWYMGLVGLWLGLLQEATDIIILDHRTGGQDYL